jgi:hypothetical protein
MRTASRETAGHAQKIDLKCQREIERRTAPIFDNTPFGVGEVEERLDLKGAQTPRQSAPPQNARNVEVPQRERPIFTTILP